MTVIKVEDLSVNYEKTKALHDVSFEVEDKEFIAIIGPNGGGKTTLVKALLGLVDLNKGAIEIAQGSVLGYIPQLATFDRNFPITVGEVILTGHLPTKVRLFHKSSKHELTHAREIMKILKIDGLFNRQIGQLSGGQMQKVLIARALMNHPNILILDEPTAGVDETSRQAIYQLLKELNKKMTIIMITHKTNEIEQYVDRIFYINQKIHIHESGYKAKTDPKTCPIDWFIKGQEINDIVDS